MKISRLRRALAVFLSVMMLTLCAPMSAFTAFATGTVYVTDIISGGIGRKLYVGDVVAAPEGSGYTYNDTTYNFVYFYFENFPESGINEDMWMNESPFERFPIRGGTFTVSNSYMRSDISRTAGSYWELTEIQGVDSYLCLLFESDGANTEISTINIDVDMTKIPAINAGDAVPATVGPFTGGSNSSDDTVKVSTENVSYQYGWAIYDENSSSWAPLNDGNFESEAKYGFFLQCTVAGGYTFADSVELTGNIKDKCTVAYDTCFDKVYVVELGTIDDINAASGNGGSSTGFTITFDLTNGGALPEGTESTATTTDGKLAELPTPTRDGYTFKGWFDAETGGKEVTTATVFEQNTTIYAQWEKNVVYPALPKVTATAGENSVSLKWTAVDGAKSYRVLYRVSGTEKWSAKNTTGTSVTVTDLTGGTKYDFLVLAYDGTNWSKYTNSDIINATPKTAAPAKPAFTVTAGENSVTVKWTAVSGAASYRVFYRLNGTEKWTAKSTTGTSVTISGLTGGKKYDFLVRAYNGTAWSAYTDADVKTATPKAVVTAPAAPVISSVTPYENSAVIKWTASNGATFYRVFYRINGTAKWSYKNTTQTAMTLWELTGGKKYDSLVRAYNGKAWSTYTAQDIKNAVPVKATPKPAITSATPGKNSVTVKWTAVSGAKSYRVFYRVKGTSKWTTVNTTRTQATVSGLTSGKTYEILVRSYSASGWSSYSLKDYAEAKING